MTYLLIDNSNTRTKFVLSAPDALLPERYMIPTREVSEERLDEVLAGVPLRCRRGVLRSARAWGRC